METDNQQIRTVENMEKLLWKAAKYRTWSKIFTTIADSICTIQLKGSKKFNI